MSKLTVCDVCHVSYVTNSIIKGLLMSHELNLWSELLPEFEQSLLLYTGAIYTAGKALWKVF